MGFGWVISEWVGWVNGFGHILPPLAMPYMSYLIKECKIKKYITDIIEIVPGKKKKKLVVMCGERITYKIWGG